MIGKLLAKVVGFAMAVAVLPRDLFCWVFRGYRWTWARITSWVMTLGALAVLVGIYVSTANPNDMLVLYLTVGVGALVFAGHQFEQSCMAESGQSAQLATRPANPWGRKSSAVDVAASRGQAVLRGSSVQAVNAAPKVDPKLIQLGGVVLPVSDECKHFLIAGRTGAGKTQAIYALLQSVVARKNPVFIADPGGGYLSRFGHHLGAYVLNPFDGRDVGWSPFAELEQEYDCDRLARAAIPDADGEAKQWHFYAQSLFAELLRSQWKQGNRSTSELLRLVFSADAAELRDLLVFTPAEPLVSGHADKMLGSTRATIAPFLNGWRFLSEDAAREGRDGFSVRKWVRTATTGYLPWLIAPYRDDQREVLCKLISCWLDLAIMELLSSAEKPDRRIWFIVDELDSLGKVGALRDGLTKLRKYGGSVVAGLQTIAQLRSTYGRDEAQVLLSCMSTRLILAAGDAETAEYFERQLGKQEVERVAHSGGNSSSLHGPSNSANWSRQQQVQSTVLASEISTLPDLHGYLQLASGSIGRVTLPIIATEQRTPTFDPKTKGAKA
jgi:hypothetical protein